MKDIQTGAVTNASVNDDGQPSNTDTEQAAISASGRFVAFTTFADNLVGDNVGFARDVYIRDTVDETTERVSVDSTGVQGDADSGRPSVSADGRYVAFTSEATNLVTGDTNGLEDIFLRDRAAGTTTRITVGPGGVERNGSTFLNFVDSGPTISGDGRFVVFQSDADNLIANDTNMATDIFVHDTASGTNTRANVASDGQPADQFRDSNRPSISDNGRFVVFDSLASNLAEGGDQIANSIYLHDRDTGVTVRIPSDVLGSQKATVSNDGQRIAFESASANLVPDDTNGRLDIFVHDRQTAPPSEVSLHASVLPTSRSVQVGDAAYAFATIINAGTAQATGCAPALPVGTGIPFSYQTTDAANATTGIANTPADIPPGTSQSFVFSLAPTAVLAPVEVAMVFACTNGDPAQTIAGVNTLLFSASNQPVGDVIALASTLGAIPGVVDIDGTGGAGAFAIATSNVGAADTFRIVPRATAGVPVVLSICETNPQDGTCLQPAGAEVQTMIGAGGTPTFTVFVAGTGAEIVLDPATRRIAVDFFDAGDDVRGGTSVAVRTN